MKKNIITEVVKKALYERENKKGGNKARECNSLINKIKGDLSKLNVAFEEMGFPSDCLPCKQVEKMYEILAGYDPIQSRLKEYLKPKTQSTVENMLATEMDLKISSDADTETIDTAMNMSNDYDKDVEIKNDEEN